MDTDHSEQVAELRRRAGVSDTAPHLTDREVDLLLAADLLEAHDDTGISLDAWVSARTFVERHAGITITENGA